MSATIDDISAIRQEALTSRDPVAYAFACEALGLEPELPELVEQAQADLHYSQRVRKSSKKRPKPLNINQQRFLEASEPYRYLLGYLDGLKSTSELSGVRYAKEDHLKACDLKAIMECYHSADWVRRQNLAQRSTHALVTTFIGMLKNYSDRHQAMQKAKRDGQYAVCMEALAEDRLASIAARYGVN